MVESPPERFFIIVRAPNGDVRQVPLSSVPVVLGRDESADIRVDDKKVSRRHATFKIVDGQPTVEDLGSSNGVWLNDRRIARRTSFSARDKVRVGGYFITLDRAVENTGSALDRDRADSEKSPGIDAPSIAEPRSSGDGGIRAPRLCGLTSPVRDRLFALREGETVMGRLEECDISILDASLSRQHARIVIDALDVSVADLGSANGTFVDDVKIDVARLGNGATLRTGNVSFRVELPAHFPKPKAAPRRRAKKAISAQTLWAAVAVAVSIAAIATFFAIRAQRRGNSGAGASPSTTAIVRADAGTSRDAETVAAPSSPSKDDAAAAPIARTRGPDGGVERNDSRASSTVPAPHSALGPDGLPVDLPNVDDSFDLDAFVAERLEKARACKAQSDVGCLREQVSLLLDRDPIHREGLALRDRARAWHEADEAIARADRLAARGEFVEATRILSSLESDLPQAESVKKTLDGLRNRAIAQAITQGKKALAAANHAQRAHDAFAFVLALEPDSAEAIDGIRAAEKALRAGGVPFAEWAASAANAASKNGDAPDLGARLRDHFDGDAALAKIAEAYALGKLDAAESRARELERSASGKTRTKAQELRTDLGTLRQKHARVRMEIANDPIEAGKLLDALERIESRLLPKGVRSYLSRELEVDLAGAFATRGASMFDRGRYEEAFQAWSRGAALDAGQPEIRAGLVRLEARAREYAKEAELASQRGDPDICALWKRITRMTRAESDVHKNARERAFRACKG